MFSEYGMPVQFYNDHYDMLISQDHLFARKISPHAHGLKRKLGDLYAQTGVAFDIVNDGKALHKFTIKRGREGRRYAPPFWVAANTLAPTQELFIIACKKWQVGRRLVAHLRPHVDTPMVEYVFSEKGAGLPDMGGLDQTMDKRLRHRLSFVRLLFDHYGSNRLVICLDPSYHWLIKEFYANQSAVRVLNIECNLSDDFLQTHAKHIGLAGDAMPEQRLAGLLPALRQDIAHEHKQLTNAAVNNHFRMSEHADPNQNAAALANFIGIDVKKAQKITQTNDLFAD